MYEAPSPSGFITFTTTMSRLVDCYPPSDDDLPEVSTLLKRPDGGSKTPAPRLRSPAKSMVPKSASKTSCRRIRRLGDGQLNTDNPLFKRWNADDDDGLMRGSPSKSRSPTKSFLMSSRKPNGTQLSLFDSPEPSPQKPNSTQLSIFDSEDPSPRPRSRALRLRQPRLAPALNSDSEESSIDITRVDGGLRNWGETATQKSDSTMMSTDSADSDMANNQLLAEASAFEAQPREITSIAEESAVFETPKHDSTDPSSVFGSDESIEESSIGADKPSPAKLLFGRPQRDEITATSPLQKDDLALKPRHPNVRAESPDQDKSYFKPLGMPKPSGDENAPPRKPKSQATTNDLADALSKLRLEFRDESDDEGRDSPATPPKKTIKVKSLVSPNKRAAIPQTPHRPSGDAFWSKDLADDWNDEHSPRKPMLAPPKSPSKPSPTKAAKKSFEARKHALADEFLAELDAQITQGKIAELAESTGGVKLVWTKTLNTTAGRANWRRETIRTKQADGTETSVRYKHHASIELAEKVIDDEERLLNVVAHEFCHLANFMVNGMTTNPHGREFKAWATKCSRAFGARGVVVTTKHTYDIDFKYVWTCAACASEYKRHSRSIDPARHRCGTCKGELKQTRPAPRGAAAKPSEYQVFMKEQMKLVRKETPGCPQKEVMRIVAERWAKKRESKAEAAPVPAPEPIVPAEQPAETVEAPAEAAEAETVVETETVADEAKSVAEQSDETPRQDVPQETVVRQMVDLTIDG